MAVELRTVTESDLPGWLRSLRTGFLNEPVAPDELVADRLAAFDLDRTRAAFDDGRVVATFRSFAQRLSTVGGGDIGADAITQVTVAPTHRRRGLLSRLMAQDLDAARERGDALATLIAAEYPIYGRYGFGPASRTAEWSVDLRRAGLDPRRTGRPDAGRVDFSDGAEIRRIGPGLHRRLAAVRAGVTDRSERNWRLGTGLGHQLEPWTEPYYAVYRSASGEPEGYVSYRADAKWTDGNQPENTLTVRDLIAATPAAEHALWRFVCSVDWVTTVRSGRRPVDDPLPELLPDPRAARTLVSTDMLWARILDVPRVLEERTYPVADALVLDVRDAGGYAGGRFRLDASPKGAACAPTTASADLVLDVADLARLFLGDGSPVRLARLGRIEEAVPGAAARAELLLRTPLRPFSPDIF
ncbi:GNAT family N-acetyltransferase [Streptomyces termitum]|uniref:UPF0256 protein n=1 Tax=Streptomyces termitum TaxID=67368 RepID=A0A918W3E6_9ACTN|nr:GNAT family N-acetyltransferase [Streptomyces termitum]GHA63175.1 UPF0256 protein [Streptomyces termitum]